MLVGANVGTHDPARAAVRGRDCVLTYGELADRTASVATRGRGWGTGTTAALIGDWTPDTLATMHALCAGGWTVGVLDPGWTDDEIGAALRQLAPDILLAADELDARLPVAAYELVDRIDGWRVRRGTLGRSDAAEAMRGAPTGATPFYVGFTSGSSGVPKAFVRSHRSWWESFVGLDRCAPLGEGAVIVPGALSSSHFLFGALHGLHSGRTVELTPHGAWSASALVDRLADGSPVAALYVVPTMLRALLDECADPLDQPHRIFCAGARLDPEVRDICAERLPATGIVEYYGASELSFVAIQTPGDGTPRGAVGRAFPGVRIAIRDATGAPLPAGATGHIYVQSPLVFDGYRGQVPESAAHRSDDGWWTVGDLGRLDADGNLFVAGRGSALIITGGANVQPEEVEGVLAGCPGVDACAVVGAPDPRWGETVVAVLVPSRHAELSRARLRAQVAAHLSRAKRPRRYVVMSEPLPLGRSGKIDRAAVRELVRNGAGREL